MPKRSAAVPFVSLRLDGRSRLPLHRQLYQELRDAILSERVRAGARLPSTRVLAEELGISRNTVVNAFEQLLAEGYLDGRVGSGTRVSEGVRPKAAPAGAAGKQPKLSQRGRMLAGIPHLAYAAGRNAGATPFQPGTPAFDVFPFRAWQRIAARHWRKPAPELLAYGHIAGYAPLRRAIAAHLKAARGVRCEPEQVIVTSGIQQAADLTARLLLDPGDAAWVENPGYVAGRGALRAAGAQLVPIAVDAEGLVVARGEQRAPRARLVYVTPSHQYPSGAVMTLSRRMALLDWARRARAWIFEDDYDSEYRFGGWPLASLQGLDTAGRVIYAGTFSKVLFPALRLAYAVVPPALVDAFSAARALADRQGPTVDQAILAEFIEEGHFARHIRATRALYAERRVALVDAAERELRGIVEMRAAEAGLHAVAWLPPGMDDFAASRAAADAGIEAPAVSAYALEPLARGGLVLGFAAFDARPIRAGIKALAAALHFFQRRSTIS